MSSRLVVTLCWGVTRAFPEVHLEMKWRGRAYCWGLGRTRTSPAESPQIPSLSASSKQAFFFNLAQETQQHILFLHYFFWCFGNPAGTAFFPFFYCSVATSPNISNETLHNGFEGWPGEPALLMVLASGVRHPKSTNPFPVVLWRRMWLKIGWVVGADCNSMLLEAITFWEEFSREN